MPEGKKPSDAWLRLLAQEDAAAVHAGPGLERDVPLPASARGACRCTDKDMEGQPYDPWVYGHFTRCLFFMATCPDCGMTCGTHRTDCSFWTTHPLVTPF